MKNLTISFSILFLANFCFAQSPLVIAPNFHDTSFVNLDVSDYFMQIRLESFLSNNSETDTLEIFWVRKLEMDCQEDWQFFTADRLLLYAVTEDSCLFPFMLYPNEVDIEFSKILLPRSTPGCGQFKVYFYSTTQPDIPLDSIQYSVKINDENCLSSTSINSLSKENSSFQIIPNPVFESFTIKTIKDFNSITIQNSIGQVVKTMRVSRNDDINISNLNSGVYFVSYYLDQRIIGNSKFLKQ